MKLENELDVAAPPERVWEYLLDLERVTPCMPGAELAELPDDRTWKGKVTVKLGAVTLSYAATVVIEEKDEEARRVVLKASGRETRGKGTAAATIDSQLEPDADGGTRVAMSTDLRITGAVAQYGRGMIADVSKRLTGEFADCLQARIAAPAEVADTDAAAAAKPIAGMRLGLWALARAVGGFSPGSAGRSARCFGGAPATEHSGSPTTTCSEVDPCHLYGWSRSISRPMA